MRRHHQQLTPLPNLAQRQPELIQAVEELAFWCLGKLGIVSVSDTYEIGPSVLVLVADGNVELVRQQLPAQTRGFPILVRAGGPFVMQSGAPATRAVPQAVGAEPSATEAFFTAASVAGMAVGAYHGYKRNDSVGWAVVWGFLGGLAPILVVPIAFAQGIGRRRST